MHRQQAPLPLSKLLFYAVVALPLATIGLPLTIYLAPFYAGEIGIPLAALGTAMLLARLVEVVVDPFIGTLSDRWRPRVGRRKIWLPIGGLMLICGVFMLFRPWEGVGNEQRSTERHLIAENLTETRPTCRREAKHVR